MDPDGRGCGEEIEELQGGKTVFEIYCMKKVFLNHINLILQKIKIIK